MLISDWSSDVCSSDLLGQVTVAASALKALVGHVWPGNVRELENTLNRALVVARGGVIGVEHLALGAVRLTAPNGIEARSEESRVGQKCVSKCRSRWSRYH